MVHTLEEEMDNKANISDIWHPRSNKDTQGLESHESQTFPPQISVEIGSNSYQFKQESFKSYSQEAACCQNL